MMNKQKAPLLYTVIIYLCGFFLFLEWLYPIKLLIETNHLTVFLIYVIYCFLITMFQFRWWLVFLMKGSGLLFVIHEVFLEASLLSKVGMTDLYMEIVNNVQVILSREWHLVTDLFQSILFLILIWLMSYLIYYWFIVVKKIFLFVLLTVLYVTILDTFTIYEANNSIIRIFILAFLSFGMTTYFRNIEEAKVSYQQKKLTRGWLLLLVAIIMSASLIGYIAPKAGPQWSDPVPFIIGQTDQMDDLFKGTTTQKSGYGTNDSELGGPFIQDNTPVFSATAPKRQYWRIESKDTYTGKGWERKRSLSFEDQPDGKVSLQMNPNKISSEASQADFYYEEEFSTMDLLVYPYGTDEINGEGFTQILLDKHSGTMKPELNEATELISNYTTYYAEPIFSIEELQNTNENDPKEVQEMYTKLPSELPDRVSQLAEEITTDYINRYDQATAIESYFSQNGFVYETDNVAVPSEQDDYVDQFLFDTKAGYCDNYSSSMVVLLRTLGIPARWVKGFTSGEETPNKENVNIYEVTNENAHSWPEVYFPNIGWVPFEPTKGFSNLAEFIAENEDQSESNREEEQEEDIEEVEEESLVEEDEDDSSDIAEVTNDTKGMKYFIVGSFVVLLSGVVVIYRRRFHLRATLIARKFEVNQDAKQMEDAYHFLLSLIAHKGNKRNAGQTLREYAIQIDKYYNIDYMVQLTMYYEQLLYNNKIKDIQAKEMLNLWKQMINKVLDKSIS